MDALILGSERKFELYISPLGNIHASQYDFTVKVFTNSAHSLQLSKDDCIMVDDDTFLVPVDTNVIGLGTINFEVTAFVPDGDFEDGFRTEKARYTTDVTVVA